MESSLCKNILREWDVNEASAKDTKTLWRCPRRKTSECRAAPSTIQKRSYFRRMRALRVFLQLPGTEVLFPDPVELKYMLSHVNHLVLTLCFWKNLKAKHSQGPPVVVWGPVKAGGVCEGEAGRAHRLYSSPSSFTCRFIHESYQKETQSQGVKNTALQ